MQMDIKDMMLAQQAETLRLSGAYAQALEIFADLQKQGKYQQNAWVNAHLGATYCKLMDYNKAEKYLKLATGESTVNKYFWAYAQLGETYRLLAITENDYKKRKQHIDDAIANFKKALDLNDKVPGLNEDDDKKLEESKYAWALAHLGAAYRLKITFGIIKFLADLIKEKTSVLGAITGSEQGQNALAPDTYPEIRQPAKDALKCLNRAIEIMPTYAWAWGMRSTVYRLTQKYENSFWDLEVETVIAPNNKILQNSSSPVPFLESGRVSLYEHAFLSFYLTKRAKKTEKKRHYIRAIAFLEKALIAQPGDLMARLMLTIIQAKQKKEELDSLNKERDSFKQERDSLNKEGDLLNKKLIQSQIQNIECKIKNKENENNNEKDNLRKRLDEFFQNTESEFSQKCQKILRYLIELSPNEVKRKSKDSVTTRVRLEIIGDEAENGHKLKNLVQEVLAEPKNEEEAQLWLWKNFALTETYSYLLFFLGEASNLLGNDSNIGKAKPYLQLALLINPYIFTERLYQTPVFSDEDRTKIFKGLEEKIGLEFLGIE
jgi:hypothetical protein